MSNDLDAHRAALTGGDSPGKQKTERIWKMFTPEDAAMAIKAEVAMVKIGSGDEMREVRIRPLNPRQLVGAYSLIRDILMPLVTVFQPNADGSPKKVEIGDILTALGDNIDKVPELVAVILSRGNEISMDWINDNFDIILDLQLILPVFMRQNGLGKLLGNGLAAVDPTPPLQNAPVDEASLPTAG